MRAATAITQKNIAKFAYPSSAKRRKKVGKISATQIPSVVPTSRHLAKRIWRLPPDLLNPGRKNEYTQN